MPSPCRLSAARPWRTLAALLTVGLVGGGSAACGRINAGAVLPPALAASGLALPEQALRDALATGAFPVAARALAERDGLPGDALLRDLYRGTVAFYGGRWAESAAALDRAAALADERYTKRVSRGALALATNDLALPYAPGRTERLLVHYYAMQAWLHRGALEDAVVEARRLAALQQQTDAEADASERPLRAALRYLTGAVFEAAGDRDDADVAYRNAERLAGAPLPREGAALAAARDAMTLDEGADASAARALTPPRGTARSSVERRAPSAGRGLAREGVTGEVVVIVERGFAAHRVDDRLSLRVGPQGGAWLAGSRGPGGVDRLSARFARLLGDTAGVWAGGMAAPLTLAGDSLAPAALDSARATAAGSTRGRATRPRIGDGPAPDVLGTPALPPDVSPPPVRVGDGTRRTPVTTGPTRERDARRDARDTVAESMVGAVLGEVFSRRRARAARWDVDDPRWWDGRTLTVAWPALARPRRTATLGGLWIAPAERAGPTVVASAAPAGGLTPTASPTAAPPAALASATSATATPAVGAPAVVTPAAGTFQGDVPGVAPLPLGTTDAGAAAPVGRSAVHAAIVTALGAPAPLPAQASVVRGDLSLGIAADFRRDRAALLSRLVARTAFKAALAREAGRKHRELGDLVALLGNVAERADTRSWHLVPGEVEVLRLRLPAGEQPLAAQVDGQSVALGRVRVVPGGVRFVTVRLWGNGRAPSVLGARAEPAVAGGI